MKLRWLIVVLVALIAGLSCSRDPNVAKKAYLESGNRYFDRGKYREASMMYRNALKKDPRYGDAYYRLGLTLLKVQNVNGALQSLLRAIDLLPAGADRSDASKQLTDIYIAGYLLERQRKEEFEKILNEFINRPQVTQFDKLRAEGYIAYEKKDLATTLSKFKEANDLRPMDNNLVLGYAQVLIAMGRFDEANKLAMDLIAKSKDFGPIYDVLYREYMLRNLRAEAESILRLKVDNNPKNLDFRLLLATHYYAANQPDEASRIIEAAVADKQTFPNAREKAGDFYMAVRNFDKAIGYYSGGLNGSKEDWLTFQRKIADALLAQGRRDEALALLEKVLKQYPKDPLALAQRASLWLDMGNPSGLANTVRELESTVSVLPPNAVLRYQLGRAYFAKGDLEQARTQFQAAVDIQADYLDPRRALIEINLKKLEWALALRLADETLAHLKEARRDDPLTRLFRAEALQGLGKVDDARNDLQAFLKQYPNSGEAMRRLGEVEIASGDSLAALGQSKSSADRYAAALRSFEECAKLSKGDFRCLANESAVYALRLRQFDKAVDLVSGELKKSPDSRELRLALANTFAMSAQNFTELKKYDAAMGRFKEAAAVYTALLAKEPENADLHNRLAEACRFMGEVGEATGRPDVAKEQFNLAIEHWRRVQQLQPKNPYAAVWLAIMLERTGQAKEAKRHYEEALQIDPENPVALNNLAFQMADGGSNLDMALTYAQRAVQSAQAVAIKLKAKSTATPDEVSDTLAWIYMKKKLTAEALAIYDKLVVNQPANPSFRYHRGLALLQKGDKLQAKKEFQTALASKPSPEERAKINADLAKVD